MRSKQNRRFKSKLVQHDYRNKLNRKHEQRIYHANINVNLTEENVMKIKSGILINVDVSVKNITYVKKIIFRILPHVVAKMENI